MKKFFNLFLFLLIGTCLQSQSKDSLNQEVSPIGGLNNLAVQFYGIDFTKDQRKILKEVEVEFIFQVDQEGNPSLSDINGISDKFIIDSLQQKALKINKFFPRIINGIPQPSIYFMQLVFPTYSMKGNRFGEIQAQAYNEARYEDFEYINKSPQRLDLYIGGLMNQFAGNPAKHLGTGGGMKIDISFTDKRQLLYGLNMSFYGNKLKKEYSINTTRPQFSAPPTLLVGIIFGKWFNQFNIQTEFNIAVQNIVEKFGDNDPDWIQLKGWSPGIIINYPIKIGKDSPMYYYGAPSIFANNLNVHLGVRPIFLSIKEATGLMLELGFSYRMTLHKVQSYKLKDEFLKQ